ncbi:mannitol dehydrogenase, putative [Phytophthora infestans T30-4]|uniref:Mannitol dehydrogenase, putative n=1 Tax=Phytophthora infestans (strain T30-4) TaxID=403677 RepID=D0NDC1_PHYIT|nr:mannitol dehydrogenase, putative [Phytophthora infestans T30-4]EEY56078.1 mannitol dehydrogenase, putative [Phytophthora infestans T30-4]|eukprot:XP_002902908.1 mannitol dehydrogenase, putative [Phytophthora infestans T30-4]
MSVAPRTIKALACFGKSEPVQLWEYESRPLGSDDVEIKISHCGICGSDLHVIDSGWKPTLYPCVVGHEIVGEVTLAGPDVKDLKMYSTAHYFAFTIAATVFASKERRFIFRNKTVSSTPSNIFFAPRRFFLVAKTLSAKPCGRPCLVSGVVIAGTVSNGCNISSWSFVSSSTAPDRATTHARSKSRICVGSKILFHNGMLLDERIKDIAHIEKRYVVVLKRHGGRVEVAKLAQQYNDYFGMPVWACLNKDPKNPCKDCAKGADAYCRGIVSTYNSKYQDGSLTYGGYAEYVRVLSPYAFKIPESIPSDAAAPLLCAGTTVFTPFKEAGLKAGDRVGIVGIGGLGHLAIQFAKAMGAEAVVAFSRSSNKEKEVLDLGADEFVNYSDPEQAKAAEDSVDILLVTADADGMPYQLFLSFLASRGTCIMVGLPNDEVHFKPAQVVMKGAKFVGSHIGSIQDVKDMLALAAEKNVRPVIQTLPMSKANEGIQMLRDGKVRYRVVLEN